MNPFVRSAVPDLCIGQQQRRLAHGHTRHLAFDLSFTAGFLLIGAMKQAEFDDRNARRSMAQRAPLQQLPGEFDRVAAGLRLGRQFNWQPEPPLWFPPFRVR